MEQLAVVSIDRFHRIYIRMYKYEQYIHTYLKYSILPTNPVIISLWVEVVLSSVADLQQKTTNFIRREQVSTSFHF